MTPLLHDPAIAVLLLVAAFVAGALNAVAGGGSFLTLPALVYAGASPVLANATGTVALLSGYVSGAWGLREGLRAPPGLSMRGLLGWSLLGGSAGAALLLWTDDRTFRVLVPWLLLGATALFAVAPRLLRQRGHVAATPLRAAAGVFAVAVYGGYFNGGLGILLLALFGLLGEHDLRVGNGLKNVVSAVLTAVAVLVYAAGGLVLWPEAIAMTVAAVAGGYVGARGARRLPPAVLRAGIVVTGLVMAGLFFRRR